MGWWWVLKVNLVIALAEPEPSLGQAVQKVKNIYHFDNNKGSLVRVSSHAFTNISLYVDTTFHRLDTFSFSENMVYIRAHIESRMAQV